MASPIVKASVATIIGLIIIPWLITDPHWRNVLLGFVGLYVLHAMTEQDKMLTPGKKAILITGCDTGLGHGMARFFDRQGFRVFAACLVSEGEGAKSLQAKCSENVKVLQLDVTKDEEVEDAVTKVKEELGDGGLWAVINNAGILNFSEVELTSMAVFQQHFDVNCLGQVRVVKAFLPLIKRCKGRVINFASVNARMYSTMFGAYCISKAAVEIFSDVLRLEMKKWGVKVSTILPLGFDTNLTRFAARQQMYLDDVKDSLSKSQKVYFTDTYFKKVMERSTSIERAKTNTVAKELRASSDYTPLYHAVDHALLSKTPRARYPAGRGARFALALMAHCPSSLADFILTFTTVTYLEKGLEPLVNMTFD